MSFRTQARRPDRNPPKRISGICSRRFRFFDIYHSRKQILWKKSWSMQLSHSHKAALSHRVSAQRHARFPHLKARCKVPGRYSRLLRSCAVPYNNTFRIRPFYLHKYTFRPDPLSQSQDTGTRFFYSPGHGKFHNMPVPAPPISPEAPVWKIRYTHRQHF